MNLATKVIVVTRNCRIVLTLLLTLVASVSQSQDWRRGQPLIDSSNNPSAVRYVGDCARVSDWLPTRLVRNCDPPRQDEVLAESPLRGTTYKPGSRPRNATGLPLRRVSPH